MSLLPLLLAGAAGFSTPPLGSGFRRDIVSAVRPAIERSLGPDVGFNVALIRVQRDWAFLVADPQRRSGRPIDGWRIFGDDFGNWMACGSTRCCAGAAANGG